MKKLILGVTTMAMLSAISADATDTGNGYINSRTIAYVPTEWVIGFIVTAGFLAIVLSNKNTTIHAH